VSDVHVEIEDGDVVRLELDDVGAVEVSLRALE